MLYWECKRRLDNLQQFRGLVDGYFQNPLTTLKNPVQLIGISDSRRRINLLLHDAIHSCHLVGEGTVVHYLPPPGGGDPHLVDVLLNMFELRDQYHIGSDRVIDVLDRTIGEYGRKEKQLHRQLFNPLFWINLILVKIVEVPFQILGAAGFNRAKIENSVGGKITKAVGMVVGFVIGLIVFVAALLDVLEKLGWLQPVLRILRIKPAH